MDLNVSDEGEFWQTRSIEQLKQRIGTYDRLVAAVAGALKDQTEEGVSLKAEILNDSRFEKLEAEGRQEFAAQIEQLHRLFQDLK